MVCVCNCHYWSELLLSRTVSPPPTPQPLPPPTFPTTVLNTVKEVSLSLGPFLCPMSRRLVTAPSSPSWIKGALSSSTAVFSAPVQPVKISLSLLFLQCQTHQLLESSALSDVVPQSLEQWQLFLGCRFIHPGFAKRAINLFFNSNCFSALTHM